MERIQIFKGAPPEPKPQKELTPEEQLEALLRSIPSCDGETRNVLRRKFNTVIDSYINRILDMKGDI